MSRRESHRRFPLLIAVFSLVFAFHTAARAQLGIAPVQPDQIGETINCYTGGNREVLAVNRDLIKATDLAFEPNNVETQKLFDEVARHTDLRINIQTVPVKNPINVQICPSDNGRNYIAYSADWVQRIYDETQNRWALYAIIAHEIGHYVLNHDRTSVGSEPPLELAADEYAGEILAKMNASLSDAQAAYRSSVMGSVVNHTHPPIPERLAAVERGWRKIAAARRGTGLTGAPPSTPAGTPPKRGKPCTTTDGIHYRC